MRCWALGWKRSARKSRNTPARPSRAPARPRGLLGARTLEDVVRLQTDFAKRSFEGFVERSAKLSELGCSLFGASAGAWGARAKS